MEWTREKTLILIDEYKKRRGLWDMTHEDYRKKDVKRTLLTEVAAKVGSSSFPIVEIEKKFHTLRTQYHREINRMRHPSSNEYKSKWFAFQHLEFLNSPKACRAAKSEHKIVKMEKSILEKKKETIGYIIKEYQINSDNLPDESITAELVIEKSPIQTKRERGDSNRELEKLIEETTKEVDDDILTDDVEHEQRDFKQRVKTVSIQHSNFVHPNLSSLQTQYSNYNLNDNDSESNNLDNVSTSEQTATIISHDGNEYNPNSNHHQPAIIRIQKRDPIAIDSSIDDEPPQKKIYYELPRTYSMMSSSSVPTISRDEHAIYGEYIANEMRFITNRSALIKLKHKINNAIFEANMSQFQK